MAKQKFLKGPALFALARTKARALAVDSDSLKLADLIHRIQEQEGHTACFRRKKKCPELGCCWQVSCGAVMEKE